MKRILSILLAVLFLMTSCGNTSETKKESEKETRPVITSSESDEDLEEEYRYVASSESDKYHRPSCHYVDKIKSYNIVYYYSENDARADGKKACSVCNP